MPIIDIALQYLFMGLDEISIKLHNKKCDLKYYVIDNRDLFQIPRKKALFGHCGESLRPDGE